MASNVLLCDSVACFVNGNFCFTRSQQLIPVEKSLYLVKTEFASVQERRVRRLEKKIYSIFTKKVPQGSFCESPVMKWTVIHYNSITPFKENRTIPPRYFHSFLKEKQEFVTVGSAFEYIYKIDSQNVKDLLLKLHWMQISGFQRQESRLLNFRIVCSL